MSDWYLIPDPNKPAPTLTDVDPLAIGDLVKTSDGQWARVCSRPVIGGIIYVQMCSFDAHDYLCDPSNGAEWHRVHIADLDAGPWDLDAPAGQVRTITGTVKS